MIEPSALTEMFTPKFDAETIATVQQRNLEAFTALGARLAAGVQSLFRRQSELVQGRLNEQLAVAKDIFSSSPPEAGLSRQLAFAQAQAKQALADTVELAGIVSAPATDALDILYKRTQETMSEIYKTNGNGAVHRAPAPVRSAAKAG